MRITRTSLSRAGILKAAAVVTVVALTVLGVCGPAFADNAATPTVSPTDTPTPAASPSDTPTPTPSASGIPTPLPQTPISSTPGTFHTDVAASPTFSISGHVDLGTAGNHAGAGEVTVQVSTTVTASKGSYANVPTDANGNYVLTGLANDSYFLFFNYNGSGGYLGTWYQDVPAFTVPDHQINIQNGSYTDASALLTLPGSLSGHVTLGSAGVPASAGEVELTYSVASSSSDLEGPSAPTLVDASGNYTIPNLPAGSYALDFEYLGTGNYQSAWLSSTGPTFYPQGSATAVSGGVTNTYNVDLPDDDNLSGTIYLGSTSTPAGAGDARVTLSYVQRTWNNANAGSVDVPGSALTDASGHFVFPNIPNATYTATVTYLGTGQFQHSTILTGALGGSLPNLTMTTTIPGTFTISGHVYLGNSSRVAGAGVVQVTATPYLVAGDPVTVVTQSDGSYVMTGLLNHFYTVVFHYLGSGSYYDATPVFDNTSGFGTLRLVADRTGLDATLAQANEISGTVTNDSGSPLAGVDVSLGQYNATAGEWSGVTDTTTDAAGKYSFTALADGDYGVAFEDDPDYAPQAYDNEPGYGSPDVIVLSGGQTKDVSPHLHPAGVISGAVTLPAGAQSDSDVQDGDVNVYLEVPDGSGGWELADGTPYPVTGSGGHYAYNIPGLVVGDQYKLFIVYSNAGLYGQHETANPITLGAGTNNVPLSVSPVLNIPSGTLVKTAASPTIYLADDNGSNFIPVLGFDQISAMGLPTAYTTVPTNAVVPDADNGTTISAAPLSSIVDCFGANYLAASGVLYAAPSQFVAGLPITQLGDDTCALLTSSGSAVPTDFYANAAGSATIWYVDAQARKYAVTSTFAIQPGADTLPTLTVAASFLSQLPTGPNIYSPGTLLTFGGSTIYMVDESLDLLTVPNLDVVSTMGYSTSPIAVSPAYFSRYTVESTPLSSILDCSSSYYIVSAGGVQGIAPGILYGLPITHADRALCWWIPGNPAGNLVNALFVKTAGSPTIWYVNPAGQKVAMASIAQMNSLSAPTTATWATVAPSFLNALPTGPDPITAGEVLRSSAGGSIYLADTAGTGLIPVSNTDVLAAMGLPSAPTSVSPLTLSGLTVGTLPLASVVSCSLQDYVAGSGKIWPIATALVGSLPVTTLSAAACAILAKGSPAFTHALFVKSASSPTIYDVDATGHRVAMSSFAQMNALSAPDPANYITVADSFLNSLPVGPAIVVPGELITSSAGGPTYLVDGASGLVPVPNLDIVSSMGLPTGVVSVSPATLTPRTVSSSPLAAIVSCSGSDFVAGSATLWPIATALVGALTVTTLDPATCAIIPKSTVAFTHALFVKSASNPTIYVVDVAGHKVAMSSFAQMGTLSAPDPANYITVADSFLNSLPLGQTPVSPGELIKSAAAATIYLVDGASSLVPVGAFDEVTAMGLATSYTTVTPTTISSRTISPTALGTIISCSGNDFVAGSGKLWPIASALVTSLPITTFDPSTCAVLPVGSVSIGHALFVKSASDPVIYYVDSSGRKDAIHSMSAIPQLSAPDAGTYLTVAAGFIAALPTGPDVIPAGSLIKSSAGPTIYLVDGSGALIPVASFATIADLGLATSYTTVSPASITGVASTSIGNLVSCGTTDYIAGSGTLWPIDSSVIGSLVPNALASTLCAVLAKNAVALSPVLIRSATTGTIYNLSGGKKVALTPVSLTTVLAGRPLVYTNVNDGYLASLPNG